MWVYGLEGIGCVGYRVYPYTHPPPTHLLTATETATRRATTAAEVVEEMGRLRDEGKLQQETREQKE